MYRALESIGKACHRVYKKAIQYRNNDNSCGTQTVRKTNVTYFPYFTEIDINIGTENQRI